jgi:hypothetical protein
MKAHIVGGGFAGLGAAALLIRDIKTPGSDITIYEAEDKLGGGFFLDGDAQRGYNLPGSIFDKHFNCAVDLLGTIPTEGYPNINVAKQFLTFNQEHPFDDQTHIVDRDLRRVHDPLRYGLTLGDGITLTKLSLTPEASLDGQLIKDWFSQRFFDTEFWLLWSTEMGSLPQHTIIEFRRYLNRFVYLFPDLASMAHVFRSQFNQHEAFVNPLVAWLKNKGVNFEKGAFVSDIEFTESSGRLTVKRIKYERGDADRRCSRRYRARDHRLAGRPPLGGNDGHGPAATPESRTVMGVVDEAGREAPRQIRQSGRVLRRRQNRRFALANFHGHHNRQGIPRRDHQSDRQRHEKRRPSDFERFGLGDLALDLRTAGNAAGQHGSGGAMGFFRRKKAHS